MNTDRLIEILSDDPEPAESSQLGMALLLAVAVGEAAAIALMLATVGPRANLQSTAHLEWLTVKLLFALSVVGVGVPLLVRSIRPGLAEQTNWRLILIPFAAALAIALAVVFFSQPQAREMILRGATRVSSTRCLLCIVFFATIPMAAVVWAVRKGAPTRLRLSGSIMGTIAGGIGAAAYAFNCTSDTIPFIAIWYGAAIAICTVVGALLGPRVLRW